MAMTPKEKAEELVLKFKELPQEGTLMFYLAFEISKQCALICVDEIINEVVNTQVPIYNYDKVYDYWAAVKNEINKV